MICRGPIDDLLASEREQNLGRCSPRRFGWWCSDKRGGRATRAVANILFGDSGTGQRSPGVEKEGEHKRTTQMYLIATKWSPEPHDKQSKTIACVRLPASVVVLQRVLCFVLRVQGYLRHKITLSNLNPLTQSHYQTSILSLAPSKGTNHFQPFLSLAFRLKLLSDLAFLEYFLQPRRVTWRVTLCQVQRKYVRCISTHNRRCKVLNRCYPAAQYPGQKYAVAVKGIHATSYRESLRERKYVGMLTERRERLLSTCVSRRLLPNANSKIKIKLPYSKIRQNRQPCGPIFSLTSISL